MACLKVSLGVLVLSLICGCEFVASRPYSYDRGSGLMTNIRGSWGPPVRYLEKRGYLDSRYPPLYDIHNDGRPLYAVYPRGAQSGALVNGEQNNQLNDYLDDSYFGEKFVQRMKEKWNNFWHNNGTTLATSQSTTTSTAATTRKPIQKPSASPKPKKSPFTWYDDEDGFEANLADDAGAPPQPANNAIMESNNSADTNVANSSAAMLHIKQDDVDYLRKFINCSNSNQQPTINASSSNNKDKKNYLSDKLKFLANIHHNVYNVGIRRPDKRLDLKAVQEQIDNARMTYNLNNVGQKMGSKVKKKETDVPALPNSLWWPIAPLVKRSTQREGTSFYHNDYLDSSDGSHQSQEDDYDYGEQAHPRDETANWFGFGRRKHRKHKKHHRRKHHKYRFWKKHHDGLRQDDVQQPQISGDSNDFNDIKNRIQPNQQEDIANFIRNVNAAPQQFDFDVDAFVANNRLTDAAAEASSSAAKESVPERAFYEFRPESRVADPSVALSNLSPNAAKRGRRDILTQHLKAIANKIHLYPSSQNDPFRWTYSASLMTDKKHVKSAEDEDNRFIDNFYLLNDGKPAAPPMYPVKSKQSEALADLDLDIELDRKFRALYSPEAALFSNKQQLP